MAHGIKHIDAANAELKHLNIEIARRGRAFAFYKVENEHRQFLAQLGYTYTLSITTADLVEKGREVAAAVPEPMRLHREQKMFVVEAEICLGTPTETIELTRSYPTHDAANNFIEDPIWHLLERAGEDLKERIYDGKLSADQIISVTVREMREDEE